MWFLRIGCIGIIVFGIYCIKNPEKVCMRGNRWMYKEEPKPSEMLQDFVRIQWIVIIIVSIIVFLLTFRMKR